MAYDKGVICTRKFLQVPQSLLSFMRTFLLTFSGRKFEKTNKECWSAEVIILHDNTRPHVVEPVRQLLDRYGWKAIEHPAYSSVMSPCDYDLFPKLKENIRGMRFQNMEQLTRQIRNINQKRVLTGIQKLFDRWTKDIQKQEDYIEEV